MQKHRTIQPSNYRAVGLLIHTPLAYQFTHITENFRVSFTRTRWCSTEAYPSNWHHGWHYVSCAHSWQNAKLSQSIRQGNCFNSRISKFNRYIKCHSRGSDPSIPLCKRSTNFQTKYLLKLQKNPGATLRKPRLKIIKISLWSYVDCNKYMYSLL